MKLIINNHERYVSPDTCLQDVQGFVLCASTSNGSREQLDDLGDFNW